MARFLRTLWLSTLGLLLALPNSSPGDSPSIDASVAFKFEFELPAADGVIHKLTSASSTPLRVFCFLGCECPLALQYGPRLQELADSYATQGVEFIGVNSNPQDSQADLARYVSSLELRFPIVKDYDRLLAVHLNATRTPEVILLDSQGRPLYRGRIDDQFKPGVTRNKPSREDLKMAINEVLAGKEISIARTEAFGCLIAKPRATDSRASVTYCGQIAKLINRHCIECHRAGEIGPFPLDHYDEVVGWADMILETVHQKRMPPWNANPVHGEFLNARGMPDADAKLLEQWVASGTPYGDPGELPQKPAILPESVAPDPDFSVVMSTKAFEIPAEGTVDYQYFVVDPKFKEDHWVNSAELVPGDRGVVHHGIVFIRPPDGQRIDGVGWLTAYVPGQRIPHSPVYRARKIPAGSKLVFQMHYTPNGRATTDISRLNLKFSPSDEVTEELTTLISINQELEIPPQLESVPIEANTYHLPRNGKLLALSPHMHLRGKTMKVRAVEENGAERVLLDVPQYDFNWQHTYILKDPLPLANISSLNFLATFDNSVNNPFNPDPNDFVTWGDQTWEEMAIVFYEVATPISNEHKPAVNKTGIKNVNSQGPPPILDRHRKLADQYFEELDRDQDGKLTYEEVERAVQLQGFGNLDHNRNRLIERDELLETLRWRR